MLSFFGLFGRSLTLSMSLLALQLSFFIRLFRTLFLFLSALYFLFLLQFLFLLFLFNCISPVVGVAAVVGGAYHFRRCLNCFTDFLLPSPHAAFFFIFRLFLTFFWGFFLAFL